MTDLLKFENLHSTDSNIEDFKIIADEVRIKLNNILFLKERSIDRAADQEAIRIAKCELRFKKVLKAERWVTDYDRAGRPISQSRRVIRDIDESTASVYDISRRIFEFEGRQISPSSWVDWKIIASSCELLNRL